jgi:dienelactone hydrolase
VSAASDATSTSTSTSTTAPEETTATTVAVGTSDAAVESAGIWLATPLPAVFLQFDIEAGPDGIVGTFDSLAEGIEGLPVAGTQDGFRLELSIGEIDATFIGELSADGTSLSGTIEAGGTEVSAVFERREERFAFDRPQTPKPPFPYDVDEVAFRNGEDGIFLAGTLTTPVGTGPFPAVVLVSGSGPQDRDETLVGHRPFAVLADAFTRAGIAVLRYDDRGVGESRGTFFGALPEDFASDAAAAVEFLLRREGIDSEAVGIVGHSEGGMLAPLVATQRDDVAFVVLLAGPGRPGAEVLITQNRDLLAAAGVPSPWIDARMAWLEPSIRLAATDASDDEVARFVASQIEAVDPEVAAVSGVVEAAEAVVEDLTNPWMRAFLRFDPSPSLADVESPVLALIGARDVQVSAAEDAPAIERALAGNPDATVMVLPGLNHLFQHAETGAMSEYALIAETFDPETIDLIVGWILERFG